MASDSEREFKRKIAEAAMINELVEAEEKARQERIALEKYLDNMDLERLEWKRLQEDMYPGIHTPDQDED